MHDLLVPATISPCGTWRWSLSRRLTALPIAEPRPLVICGYNPSTADHTVDDPTIRREIDFGVALGCNVLVKVNLFAGRATDPNDLATMDDPVGAENDAWIRAAVAFAAEHGGLLVAAWGVPKGRRDTRRLAEARMRDVQGWGPWEAFAVTKDGYPRHPLYLPKTARPSPWQA